MSDLSNILRNTERTFYSTMAHLVENTEKINVDPSEENPETENAENNECEPGPSARKKRKKTSHVWNHFTIKTSSTDNKTKHSYCNYCDK